MFKLTVLFVTIIFGAVLALGQSPTLQIVTPDGPNLPADLYYGTVKVKPLRLRPGTNQLITIDDADFFVHQQYVDFLNRFPDAGGFAYWKSQIDSCGTDQACIHNQRVNVSDAFFFEQEFQQTGAYVYRLYRVAFGNSQPAGNPSPDPAHPGEDKKMPLYSIFKADRQQVVGGTSLAQEQLNLANAFVLRTDYQSKYPTSLTADQYVDALLATINGDLNVDLSSQRSALISLYNSAGGGPGAVLYRLADANATNPISNGPLIDAEYNRGFVYTQYAGYLRRDSDIAGFLFWLGQVNSGPLRDTSKQHAMVCSFVTSAEYQLRFGSAVTHTNRECPQ